MEPTEAEPASRAGDLHRPPPWRDVRVIRVALQIAFVVAAVATLWWLYDNLATNLDRLGIRRDFSFLDQPAGFTIFGSDFSATSSIREALWVGLQNTLRVALLGIVLALVIGIVVGVMRLSTNWLARRTASIYVELLRNIPPLVLMIFFYLAVLQTLPGISEAGTPGGIMVVSNRGVWLPWVELGEGTGAFAVTAIVALLGAMLVAGWRRRSTMPPGVPTIACCGAAAPPSSCSPSGTSRCHHRSL
jgi:general L-amino acid transport system permease protein